MRYNFSLLFLVSIILFTSCKKDKVIPDSIAQKITTVGDVDKKINVKINIVRLNPMSLQEVDNWVEYQNINEFVKKFYKTSTKEVLFNSNQLTIYAQQLKDSIRNDKFKIPSLKIRLNVLHNETLRLADMDSIPSITNKEIIQKNKDILGAFNAVNMGINTLIEKGVLLDDLSEFDHVFKMNKEDSIAKSEKKLKKKNENRIKKRRKRRIQPLSKKSISKEKRK